MAGCSPISDGASPDSLQILHKLQSKGSEDLRLRRLLDQILSAFFKEIRPLPPTVLGDGRSVDFFKLYWAVREKGGYDSVNANGSWGPLMEEVGLGSTPGSSAKWIYVKYLDAFDRWLQRISKEIVVGDGSAAALELAIKGLLCRPRESEELGLDDAQATPRGNGHVDESGVRGPTSEDRQSSELGSERNEVPSTTTGNGHVAEGPSCGAQVNLGFDMNEVPVTVRETGDADNNWPLLCGAQKFFKLCSDGCESQMMMAREIGRVGQSSIVGPLCGPHQFPGLVSERNEVWTLVTGSAHVGRSVIASTTKKSGGGGGEKLTLLDPTIVYGELNSLKRKRERECLLGMVDWLKRIAKDPCSPCFGMLMVEPMSRFRVFQEYWEQMLQTREGLHQRRRAYSIVERSLWQKRQKMHPSMYEDTSQRLPMQRRSLSISCLGTTVAPRSHSSKCLIPKAASPEIDPNKRVLRTLGSLTAQKVVGLFCKDQIQKRVPVGPYFQAELSEWTGVPSNYAYDAKWLGTQHWPPKFGLWNVKVGEDLIGKGRSHTCSCLLPRSVECVRSHVADRRSQLKDELGSAFYEWRFDRMGEEVSLTWTGEEEGIFEAIASQNNPALAKSLWDQTFRSFYTKSRESFISYYFNVFLLRRRSYQNRVTPNHTDSDDEESGFGFLRNGFGRYAIKASGSNSILCGQNKQCAGPNGSNHVN